MLQYITIKIKMVQGRVKSFKFGVSSVEDIARQLHNACSDLIDVGPITDGKGAIIRGRKDIKHGATLFANTSIFKGSKMGKRNAPAAASSSAKVEAARASLESATLATPPPPPTNQYGKKEVAEYAATLEEGDKNLLNFVSAAEGSHVRAGPGLRKDGERGLFALTDLEEGDVACWIPESIVWQSSTTHAGISKAVQETLQRHNFPAMQQTVYEKMLSVTAMLLYESAKNRVKPPGHPYAASLPEAPTTINKFTPAQQKVAHAMAQKELLTVYDSIGHFVFEATARAGYMWKEIGATPPTFAEATDAMFFALSRISNLRLVPLADLANSALPGDSNTRIIAHEKGGVLTAHKHGTGGVSIIAKKSIKKGTELTIEYNHTNPITMLCSYGCTLGMSKTRSVRMFKLTVPDFLSALNCDKYAKEGTQLIEGDQYPFFMSEEAFVCMRMASFPDRGALVEALRAGFFANSTDTSSDLSPLRMTMWSQYESEHFRKEADRLDKLLQQWKAEIGPLVESMLADSGAPASCAWVSATLDEQYKTECRLLEGCAKALRQRAL